VFCACPADSWGAPPNTHICPVCVGLPGVLPVLNRAVIEKAVLLAAAMQCAIQPQSFFDRKNYFYPDLPKGYQITQYDMPIGRAGGFDVPMPDGGTRHLTVHKMHMEEDAGKTKNDPARGVRLIDMNRCGVPLIEMVTGPDLRSADEAAQFLIRLRQLLRWLDVSEANMERGHLRCDANVSIREAGTTTLNPKTEIKNVNSIEAVRDAIEKEIERQTREVSAGRRVEAWTLEWDEDSQTLRKMRSKETEADYRYFREPDLLSVQVSDAWRDEILARLPELPLARRARFMEQYRLPAYDATLLTEERSLSDYFEEAVRLASIGNPLSAISNPKTIANWAQNEILRLLNDRGLAAAALPFTPAHLAELVRLVEDQIITRQTAVSLIPRVMESGRAPKALVEAEGLAQISGDEAIRTLAQQVIAENPDQVENYRKKPTLLKWFVGQVMKKSQGKANAQLAEKILQELLK
ncbi:MAG: Asp-tRNA(Asn)/Glu-tRNA(Gln) amidotransferase subunit GatB, partial [Anaerolineales bacterium]